MNQPIRPTLWALFLVAVLATACARPDTEELAPAEPSGPAVASAATAADAADELAEAARAEEAEAAEARLIAESEAELRAREEELARRELEERERRLREREREVAEREARLAAARAEQERLEQQERSERAAAEETRLAAERAEQERAEAERAAAEAEQAVARAGDASAPDPGGAQRDGWSGDEGWRRGSRSDDQPSTTRPAPPAAAPELLRAGMQFDVEIEDSLSSGTNQVGDTFRTELVADVRTADGTLVAPAGSELWGEVVEVRPLRRVGGQAALGLTLDRLVLPTGESVEIRANLLELGKNKKGDKARIAGAVIAGAILGSILGDSEGALVGAAAGAAASTAYVVKSEGREVEIPAGTVVTLEIEEVVTVRTEYREPRRR